MPVRKRDEGRYGLSLSLVAGSQFSLPHCATEWNGPRTRCSEANREILDDKVVAGNGVLKVKGEVLVFQIVPACLVTVNRVGGSLKHHSPIGTIEQQPPILFLDRRHLHILGIDRAFYFLQIL